MSSLSFYANIDILYKFFLALALGALIGIEREKSHQQHKGTDFAGIRTFMLITIMGALSAYLTSLYYPWMLAVFVICFVVVVLAGYILSSIINKDIGMTTEMSAILAFLIGILVFISSKEIPILIAIVVTLILSLKTHIHQFVYNLKSAEFFDTIKFLLIAFVILPLLKPIEPFGPFNAINLYEIWLMVVFVSGLSYVGYILIKFLGPSSGAVIEGILGGVLSSTAVVSFLANKSKEQKEGLNTFVVAAAIANATMFLRVLVEVSILKFSLVEKLAFPLVLLALAGYLTATIKWKRSEHTKTELQFSSPLMLKPALKFGFFYGFTLILSNILTSYFGSKGILIAAFVSGIADVDALTIFVARNPALSASVGIAAIIIAVIVNTIIKIVIARIFGTKEFSMSLMKILIPAILVGVGILIFL